MAQENLRCEMFTAFFGSDQIVAQEPNRNRKPEPSEPFSQEPKAEPEPPELFFSGTETAKMYWYRKNPFGTVWTEKPERLELKRSVFQHL